MFPINIITFREEEDCNKNLLISSEAKLHAAVKIAKEVKRNPREIAMAKEHIRCLIWRDLYGDLLDPIAELQEIARRSDRDINPRLVEICKQINTLLTYPS